MASGSTSRSKTSRAYADAAKYGKAKPGPRRKLLAVALARDDAADALTWAGELLALVPADPDANYVKAIEALDREPADLEAAKPRVAVLKAAEPDPARAPSGRRPAWRWPATTRRPLRRS